MDRKSYLMDFVKNEIMRNSNAKLDLDTDLLGAGILDSLGILQMVSFIEKTFNISVPDEDVVYDNFMSINTLVKYLQRY